MKTHNDMTEEKAWQFCKAGHTHHVRKNVPTELGDMLIYDYERYMGFDGYCSGQDDISRTLKLYGVWEPIESAEIRAVLEAGNKDHWFVDIGAHVGWYSKMAGQLGYKVSAFEADEENCQLLGYNAPQTDVTHAWLDENTEPIPAMDIELAKIDIEGNEQWAVLMLKKSLEAGKVKHIYMEVSPTFNDSYPALVEYIEGFGFDAFENGKPFNHKYDFPQTNLLFKRIEV